MIHRVFIQNFTRRKVIFCFGRQLLENSKHDLFAVRQFNTNPLFRVKDNNLCVRLKIFENVILKNGRRKGISNLGSLFLKRSFCTKPSRSPTAEIVKVSKELRKHKQTTAELRRLFSLAKNEKWYLLAAIGCLLVSSAVTLGVPHAIGKILDMIVMDNFPKEKLHLFCIILFGIFVAGSFANFGRIFLMNNASKKFAIVLSSRII